MRRIALLIILLTVAVSPTMAQHAAGERRVASFTLPSEAAPDLYVPYVSIGHEGVQSAVRIFNTATGTSQTTLSYRDSAGTLVKQITTAIPPHGSALFGPASLGSLPADFRGSLAVHGNQPLAAVALYDLPAWTGDGLMACAAESTPELALAVPGIVASADGDTLLAVRNTGSGPVNLNVNLYANDGTQVVPTLVHALAGHGTALLSVQELIAPATSFAGSVHLSAAQPLAAYALHIRPGQQLAECSPGTEALSLVFPLAVDETYALPKITNSSVTGFSAPRWLAFNPSPNQASDGTMTYFDINGLQPPPPPPPGETHTVAGHQTIERLVADAPLPARWNGAGLYQVNNAQVVRVLGSDVLSATQPYLGSYAAREGATTAWLPAVLLAPNLLATELAVQNASDRTLNIASQTYDVLGNPVYATTDSLQRLAVKVYGPDGKLLTGLPDEFTGGGAVESTNGYLVRVVASLAAAGPMILPGCEIVDLDQSGRVGINDVQTFAAAWGTLLNLPGYVPELDLNQNGVIDLLDLTMAADWWHATC